MKKSIIILILVLIGVGGVVGVLYTQLWNPSWNPFRPDPQVVLSKMSLKMKELKTFHVEGDFEMEGDYEANISTNVILDIDRTSIKNTKIKGIIKLPTYLTKIEFIRVDKDVYLEPGILSSYLELYLAEFMGEEFLEKPGGFKNKWIKINQKTVENIAEIFSKEMREEIIIGKELSEEKQQELIQEIIKLFIGKKFYEVKEELPDKEIGNQLFYHYLITLNQDEIKKLASDMTITVLGYSPIEGYWTKEEYVSEMSQGLQKALDEYFKILGDIDFEVWIGQKDNYLHRLKFEKEDLGKREIESILIDIKFSEFNQPREIEPPGEFIDMEKVLESVVKKIIDSERQRKLEDITKVLYWYYADHNRYPVSIGVERMGDKDSNVYKSLVPNYLSEDSLIDPSSVTPKDPEFSYMYKSDGQTFELSFQLESSGDIYKITRGSKLCEEEKEPSRCYYNLGRLTLDPLFCRKCKEFGGMGLVNMCYEYIAFETKNPKVCDEIDVSWKKGNCYCHIGKETANELLCDKCKELGRKANDCYEEVASKTKNPKVCDKMEKDPYYPRAKERCVNKAAPPDLLIKGVTYYWSQHDDRMFNIRIENKGLSDVWGFSFKLSSPDIELSKEDSICSGWVVIRKGEESDGFVCIIKKETLSKTEKKYITVKFKVDGLDEFEELDETNNEFTLENVPI